VILVDVDTVLASNKSSSLTGTASDQNGLVKTSDRHHSEVCRRLPLLYICDSDVERSRFDY